ncbi:unnamed protein product, partial [Gulo gulo]
GNCTLPPPFQGPPAAALAGKGVLGIYLAGPGPRLTLAFVAEDRYFSKGPDDAWAPQLPPVPVLLPAVVLTGL